MANHRARKRFGQNFLVARPTIEKIISLIDPRPMEKIIEIGPGRGALTLPLVECGAEVWAIEIDRDLVALLQDITASYDSIHIISGDFLDFEPDPVSLPRFTLVGNLPYNITSPVVDWCVHYANRIDQAVFMVQAELADRLSGKPGSKDWSPLAIFTQKLFDIQHHFRVSPGSFRPSPNVQSAVVSLTPRDDAELPSPAFERVVRSAFKHRRKTLVNNLTAELVPDSDTALALLSEVPLEPKCRAEQVTTEQFLTLTSLMTARKLV
ncbi:ribosomal RNA small subunit methyltransferase A [candidate division GN15 bacterium]|nr:ribosomal RNA small subunit methyltransferase A [candidate division GN15 bacterium]